jgi:transposase InsO family protein
MCEAAGFTRQAHYSYLRRSLIDERLYHNVYDIVTQIRKVHSSMGLRKIWYRINPDWIGRDNFISIGIDLGLEVPRPRNYQRTTFSVRSNLYTNLTTDLEIKDINVVWVSDITYFYSNGNFYYITFIEDVYSRRIIGWIASQTLQAKQSCKALKKAIQSRSNSDLSRVIHHSDKGVQYTSDAYIGILKENKIRVSLCCSVYENTHIERLNGIIKNEYLCHAKIESFEQLTKKLDEAIYLYNSERPHFSLGYSTPVEYEKSLLNIPLIDRKKLIIWTDKNAKRKYYQSELFN